MKQKKQVNGRPFASTKRKIFRYLESNNDTILERFPIKYGSLNDLINVGFINQSMNIVWDPRYFNNTAKNLDVLRLVSNDRSGIYELTLVSGKVSKQPNAGVLNTKGKYGIRVPKKLKPLNSGNMMVQYFVSINLAGITLFFLCV